MDIHTIKKTAGLWEQYTWDTLDLCEVSYEEMEELLLKTYEIMFSYRFERVVAKEVCRMLLNIEDFIYFLSVMEANEKSAMGNTRMYQLLFTIIKDMEKGFLSGDFACAYPVLKINLNDNIIDLKMDEPYLKKMIEK